MSLNRYTINLETRFAQAGSEKNIRLYRAMAWLEMMRMMHGKDNERINCRIIVNDWQEISCASIAEGLAWLRQAAY